MSTVRVKDMTRDDPDSDLAAVVQFPEGQRAVHVLRDGTVQLISPAGTVIARFQEEQKRIPSDKVTLSTCSRPE